MLHLLLIAWLIQLVGVNGHFESPATTDASQGRLAPRQVTSTTSIPTLFNGPKTTTSASSLSPLPTSVSYTTGLVPVPTVPVANIIGLIVPNPIYQLYTNLSYQFGFVDSGRPSEIVPGWLREVSSVVILPNRSVDIFPPVGSLDPTGNGSRAVVGDLLCSSQAVFNYPYAWGFKFSKPGWHMFVVNDTRSQPTITNGTCMLPIQKQRSFFATYSLSVRPYPTSARPVDPQPTDRYTVFMAVSTNQPGPLPAEPSHENERLGLGLGLGGMVLLVLSIALGTWWLRKRRQRRAESPRFHSDPTEALAFSRLSARDQEQFLRDNPDSQLNPYRSSRWSPTAAAIARGEIPTSGPATYPGLYGEGRFTHVQSLGSFYQPAQGLALVDPHATQVASAPRRHFWSRW
ncbi:uncharacterized protein LOC62_04G005422 [Vanrija pseudolonga]|uniref:Peptidase A1 domain-containing protein n=1 Tax=Vanrija pseudolonga TaxID=143232 RepID=A0AAF0Y8J9_9TREE|nr:hypothetical protein LOC62_04G005422 [Vanrija pseudolonga]